MIQSLRSSKISRASLLNTGGALVLVGLSAACGTPDTSADAGGDAAANTDASTHLDVTSLLDGTPPADGANPGDGTDSNDVTDAPGNDVTDAPIVNRDGGNPASILPVDLGTAGNYVILAKSAISTVPTSVITGDLGLSPAAATYITGFSLIADATNVFSTSPQVTGHIFASNYAVPSPSNLTTAVGDMQLAYTDAAGRAPNVTELGAGNIGGMTLTPGVYQWGTGLIIPTDLTLTGSATSVWIFQVAQNLTVSNATNVSLTGGALPRNVFWQVAGAVDVGTTAHIEGVILSATAITLRTGASIRGRLMAQTAVSIDSSTVTQPAP